MRCNNLILRVVSLWVATNSTHCEPLSTG